MPPPQFTMGATGDKVKGRYSYNYVKEDGIWKIQHHHSSVMPELIAMGKAITEEEVRGLFSLWNNALATEDPKEVAKRYSKAGVLLPTVSDTPRTDFASIEDYFVHFLKLKPQGEILESHVTIGKNTCSDVGIYEVRCVLSDLCPVALAVCSFRDKNSSHHNVCAVHHGRHWQEG